MTRKLYLPPLLFAAFFVFILFWFLATVTNSNIVSMLIRAITIPVAVAVVTAYAQDSLRALFARRPDGVFQLCLGVACNWLAVIGGSSWVLLFRLAGQPLWMLHADLPNMFATLGLFGAFLHISAPGSIYGKPNRAMVAWGIALGCLTMILVVLVSFHPDMRAFTDRLRPYLEDKTFDRQDSGDRAAPARLMLI